MAGHARKRRKVRKVRKEPQRTRVRTQPTTGVGLPRDLLELVRMVRSAIEQHQALHLTDVQARRLIQPLVGDVPPVAGGAGAGRLDDRYIYHPPGQVPSLDDVLRIMQERLAAGRLVHLSNKAAGVILHALVGDPLPKPTRPYSTGWQQRLYMAKTYAERESDCHLCPAKIVVGQQIGLDQNTMRWGHWDCAQAAAGDPNAPRELNRIIARAAARATQELRAEQDLQRVESAEAVDAVAGTAAPERESR